MHTILHTPQWRIWGCLVAIFFAGCATPPSTNTLPTGTDLGLTAAMQANREEKSVLVRTNELRREHGLNALRAESRLMEAARRHATEMARRDRYGDNDINGHVLDGLDHGARVQKAGYAFARVAENVGWQIARADPVAMMISAWMHSPSHRRNLLIAEVTDTGIGAAQGKSGRWFFVQLFAKPFESTRRSTSRMMSQTRDRTGTLPAG